MKVVKNKKGFTLVELLVAISIMGIIMVIALPQISNLQTNNRKTKYKKYAESMLTSAKLYTDSYTEDMFGNDKSGCIDVPYSDLKDKDLIKDIKVDGSTCSSENTFVRVRKANDQYFYEASIYCVDKNNKVVYDERLTPGMCDGAGPDEEGPTIKITPNSKGWTKGTNEKVTIKIYDDYGLLENVKVKITWTKDGSPYGTATTYDFKNKRYAGQGEANAITKEITVPQNETGIFKMTVTPIDVRDSVGNYQTGTLTSGEYKLDNEKPTITGHTNDSNNAWVNTSVVITATADDNSRSGVKQIYYYYTSDDKKTDWDSGSTASSVKGTWTAERNKQVYVIAKDNAGNYSDPVSVGYVKIDKTKPSVSDVTNSKKNTWTNGNVTIAAKASENGTVQSGLNTTYYYYTSDDKKTDWDSGSTASSVTGTWSAERNQEVFIITKDNAGNYSDPVSAGKVMIDKTNPTITSVTNPKNGVKTIAGLTVTLAGNDPGTISSGLSKWQYKNGSSGTWTNYANSNTSPFVVTYNDLMSKTTVYYRLCDVAGNCSTASNTSVEIVAPCSSTTTTWSGTWGSCTSPTGANCGSGTKTMTGTKYSVYNNANCGADSKSESCDLGSCETPINATKYDECDEYYITTCIGDVCNYTYKNSTALTGTISKGKLTDLPNCNQKVQYCDVWIYSLSGTTVYYKINGPCTRKDYSVQDSCSKAGTAYGNQGFAASFSGVTVGDQCGMRVWANETMLITKDSEVQDTVSWHTIRCATDWYCTSWCGSSACVGTKPDDWEDS